MQSATQAALQQILVQQAKQNAERAEQTARSLRAQADAAQNKAHRAQENARSVSVYFRSNQAETAAGQARQGGAMIRSTIAMRESLAGTTGQVTERQNEPRPATAMPVVNTFGQITGTVVNITA
jgi:hypothetical protein